MVDFNKMPCIYWDEIMKINYLQRYIIIHSILYYELSESVIPDKYFDSVSKQLVNMQNGISEKELSKTQYYYCMYDFDGTTGFDLYSRLNKKDKKHLMCIARNILKY